MLGLQARAIFRFYLVTADGVLRTIQLNWVVNHSDGLSENDVASAVVIDGACAKVTPFRRLVVPPPMSAFEIKLPATIRQVRLFTLYSWLSIVCL